MSDNVTLQSTTPATPPDNLKIAAVEATFSGDTVQAGVAVLGKSTGAEGSRALTLVEPATEGKQDTAQVSLDAILAKISADPATQITLAAILAKVSADPATQTTLAAVLAKLTSDPSTATLQTSANSKLDQLHTDLDTTLVTYVDGLETLIGTTNTGLSSILVKLSSDPATQTTLAAILAKLIAAPATESKQDTGNTSLSSLDGKTPSLGQAVAGGSVPVVLPAAQITTLTPPAAITGFATSAKQDTGNTSLGSIDTKTPALGQALAAASVPVVLPAAQLTTLTPPAAITGFATETTLGTRLSESDFDTKVGSLTETAPGSDTASSGLNGRLQRIAQRITSLITALGSPFQAGGSIGNTTFASTVADGASVTLGAKADAKSTATDTTAITAMSVWKQISASVQSLVTGTVLAAGTALIGKVGLDQTTPGTTNAVAPIAGQNGVAGNAGAVGANVQRMTLASDDPAVAALGATSGAAIITDIDGTIQRYLRGIVKLLITTATYPEKAIYGSTTTVIDTASDIAAGAFSGAPAAVFDNTADAVVPYARWAKAVASFPDWAAAPVAGTTVDLYGSLQDVDSTNDDTQAPTGSTLGGGRYFGSFIISADDALQRRTITIDLLGIEKVNFYIKNGTAQNMNNDGGTNAIVKITPFAYGMVV